MFLSFWRPYFAILNLGIRSLHHSSALKKGTTLSKNGPIMLHISETVQDVLLPIYHPLLD